MRKNLTRTPPGTPPALALDRVLAGLEPELVEATDEEIRQAAADLGMNLAMKGSAAFLGVKFTYPKSIGDVFDLTALLRARARFISARRTLPGGGSDKEPDDEQ